MRQFLVLSPEEESILNGNSGPVLQKVMKSVVLYGESLGATKLVPITGPAHIVTGSAPSIAQPYFDMLNDLIASGLKITGFTANPRPFDFENCPVNLIEKFLFNLIYRPQKSYEKQLNQLGIRDANAFSCASYLPEVGNIPKKGDILAWSESSAVSYVNSVLGARSNRNSGGIEILFNILGKVPCNDLLTDEGRQATWLIQIHTSHKPDPQLLGSAIGLKVMEQIPYIEGLDRFLGTELNQEVKDYLKDMGAAAASNGSVGLYHVENLTPEALDQSKGLLQEQFQTYIIDDEELKRIYDEYPKIGKNQSMAPSYCFIGCPHLSFQQVITWIEKISLSLKQHNQKKLKIPTFLITSPAILQKIIQNVGIKESINKMGLKIASFCPVGFMENPLIAKKPVITNSNKLRTYTSARFLLEESLIEMICIGKISETTINGRI
jgi:hypothetical protein